MWSEGAKQFGNSHTNLAKRWEARQQILRPDTAGKDRYLLARTEHWSMLPEAAAIISVLANHHHDALTGQRHLTRSLSRALHLDRYWSTGTADHFDAHHILMPLRRHLAERTRSRTHRETDHNPASKIAARRP